MSSWVRPAIALPYADKSEIRKPPSTKSLKANSSSWLRNTLSLSSVLQSSPAIPPWSTRFFLVLFSCASSSSSNVLNGLDASIADSCEARSCSLCVSVVSSEPTSAGISEAIFIRNLRRREPIACFPLAILTFSSASSAENSSVAASEYAMSSKNSSFFLYFVAPAKVLGPSLVATIGTTNSISE